METQMIRNTIAMATMLLGMTGCEAFKGQGSVIDTTAIGPTAEEPTVKLQMNLQTNLQMNPQ